MNMSLWVSQKEPAGSSSSSLPWVPSLTSLNNVLWPLSESQINLFLSKLTLVSVWSQQQSESRMKYKLCLPLYWEFLLLGSFCMIIATVLEGGTSDNVNCGSFCKGMPWEGSTQAKFWNWLHIEKIPKSWKAQSRQHIAVGIPTASSL